MKKLKPFQIYLATLIILNIILSIYTFYIGTQNSAFCIAGGDCKEVQNSKYGQVLGIKVSLLGAIAFTILLSIYIWANNNKRKRYPLYLICSLIGGLSALYFIYLQKFVIEKYCSTCLVIDFLSIIICLMSLYEYKKIKNSY
ncbi:hypothetical protein COU54_02285 [Candidatus Pacearchaeota archaeon CG10_big_fil_rev_8_21_14_0_10_31_24]|nr:MAG: hypothetical protein COU54_02285 [Candidatus Pacearchaeota archaeon CG10_big_fil_rev_8_21_14_0_10_31_24]